MLKSKIMRCFKRGVFLEKPISYRLIYISLIVTTLVVLKKTGLILEIKGTQNNVFSPNIIDRKLYEKAIDFMPVDIVYTWVNGTDPQLIEDQLRLKDQIQIAIATGQETDGLQPGSFSLNRFADKEQLRYSLRSVELYLPWIRHIYIVTNGQIPSWLDMNNPWISVVPHSDIYSNKSHLPTFNSASIESHLHQIPGISKHFIYLNDDIFLNSPVELSDFYTEKKGQKIYQAWPKNPCKPKCFTHLINDGICDEKCNFAECGFDGGDCKPSNEPFPNDVGLCAPGCPNIWLSDRTCDSECRTPSCGMDGGDCGFQLLRIRTFGIDYNPTTPLKYSNIRPPLGTKSMYINMASFMRYPNAIILNASHDNPEAILHSTVYQPNHIIILLFNDNVVCQTVDLTVQFGSNGLKANVTSVLTFSIHVQTASLSVSQPTNATTMCEGLQDKSVNKETLTSAFVQTKLSFSLIRQLRSLGGVLYIEDRRESPYSKCFEKEDLPAEVITDLNTAFHSFQDGSITLKQYKAKKSSILNPYEGSICQHNDEITARANSTVEPIVEEELGAVVMDTQQHKEQYTIGDFTGQKQLLDMFSDSINHVDGLFTKKYGWNKRHVIEHMPHFIDRDIMSELQSEFPEEYEATSSHKTRHEQDMQFAFSYMAYVTEKKPARPMDMLWNDIDKDKNGSLSEDEIQLLAVLLYGSRSNPESKILETNLKYCARGSTEAHKVSYQSNNTIIITRDVFFSCPFIVSESWRKVNSYRKYKHELLAGRRHVQFIMVEDKIAENVKKFNEVRERKTKFVCLNDDVNPNSPRYNEVTQQYLDLYNDLFPVPSSFELLNHKLNKHLHVEDWRVENWREREREIYVEIVIIEPEVMIVLAATITLYVLYCYIRKALRKRKRLI